MDLNKCPHNEIAFDADRVKCETCGRTLDPENTSRALPKVQTVVAALKADGWVHASFAHTGGGCRAIQIFLGSEGITYTNDYTEILITDSDGPFTGADWDSDEYVTANGVWCLGGYNAEGDHVTGAEIPEGESWAKFEALIVAAVNRLAAELPYRAMVEKIGAGFHPDTAGDNYTSLPEGITANMVDTMIQTATENGVDVDLVALDVLEGGA